MDFPSFLLSIRWKSILEAGSPGLCYSKRACFRYQGQRQVPRALAWDPGGQNDPKINYTMQWREVSLRSPQEGGTDML